MPVKFLKWSSTTIDISWFWSLMQSIFIFFPSFLVNFQSFSYCKYKPLTNSFQSYLFCYKCWLFFSNRINDILYNLKSICSAILYAWEWMEMLYKFLRKVAVVHSGDQSRISKTVYGIRCVMVCKTGFTNQNTKIVLLRASTVVNHYIKLSLNWGRQTQQYFNVSSPSSLRGNYTHQVKTDYASLWTTYFLMLTCFV